MRFGKFKKTKHVTVLVSNCGKHARRAGNHKCGFTTVCAKLAVASLFTILFHSFFCTSKTSSGSPFFDMERLVVVNHRWQSKNADGPTGVSAPSIYLSLWHFFNLLVWRGLVIFRSWKSGRILYFR